MLRINWIRSSRVLTVWMGKSHVSETSVSVFFTDVVCHGAASVGLTLEIVWYG